jgi:hypothetical protein
VPKIMSIIDFFMFEPLCSVQKYIFCPMKPRFFCKLN